VLSQNGTTKVWTITTDNGDHVSTAYDRLGRATTTTDQRGVVHSVTVKETPAAIPGPSLLPDQVARSYKSHRQGRWQVRLRVAATTLPEPFQNTVV